jgi:hypothetical protein
MWILSPCRQQPAARRRRAILPPSIGLVLLLAASFAGAAASDKPTLQDLGAFAGCWRTEGAGYTEEIWSAPTANLMLGLTLFVREGRAVEYELTRVELVGERIVMTPYPNGRASEHGFVLTSSRDGEAIFEAPEHDYPKRILYRSNADGSRTARIDGGAQDDGGQEWRFRRVACPGASR